MTTPFQFGAKGDSLTNDTAALQRWADHGGGEIPAGNFRFNAPVRFGPGFKISRWEGNLLMNRGWPSGYALCSHDWKRPTGGVRIDATAGGEIIYVGYSDLSRKGIGLTYLKDFELLNATVVGGAAPPRINLFSVEVRGCDGGKIRGGRFSIRSGQQGADGIHFTATNSDISVVGAHIESGDDSVGVTVETPNFAGSIMQRLSFIGCKLANEGHSSLKVLLNSVAGNAVIRDLLVRDCTMRTSIAQQGIGVPVIAINRARTAGGKIEGLVIEGGATIVVPPPGGYLGSEAMQFRGIDGLRLSGHSIHYWSPVAINALDCPNLIIERCPIEPVGAINPTWRRPPLLRIESSPGARVDLAGVRAAWRGQALRESP